MISRTAEYALRAVVWLAYHTDLPQTTQQIAEGTAVPAGYLSKVLQSLGRARIVHSQRGLHGGFVLQQPSDALTVLDVVNAVAPLHRVLKCPLDLPVHEQSMCRLHRLLNEAIGCIENVLRKVSVLELISGPAEDRALFHAPSLTELCIAGAPARAHPAEHPAKPDGNGRNHPRRDAHAHLHAEGNGKSHGKGNGHGGKQSAHPPHPPESPESPGHSHRGGTPARPPRRP